MNRVAQFEEQFKKRYNREVEVYVDTEVKDKKITKARVRIVSPSKKEYILEEHFTDEQLTDFVIVEKDSRSFKYKTYVSAEIFVADAIGEEE